MAKILPLCGQAKFSIAVVAIAYCYMLHQVNHIDLEKLSPFSVVPFSARFQIKSISIFVISLPLICRPPRFNYGFKTEMNNF